MDSRKCFTNVQWPDTVNDRQFESIVWLRKKSSPVFTLHVWLEGWRGSTSACTPARDFTWGDTKSFVKLEDKSLKSSCSPNQISVMSLEAQYWAQNTDHSCSCFHSTLASTALESALSVLNNRIRHAEGLLELWWQMFFNHPIKEKFSHQMLRMHKTTATLRQLWCYTTRPTTKLQTVTARLDRETAHVGPNW